MIVVGMDPGARSTGVVLVEIGARHTVASLLHRVTLERRDEPLLDVSPGYLANVVGIVRDTIALAPAAVDLVAVEGIKRPGQFLGGTHARGGKGGAAADPSALMATAVVLGAILGRSWAPAELLVLPPGSNGSRLSAHYPAELLDRDGIARPGGKRRHERSAYDCAVQAASRLAWSRRSGSVYL